MKTYEVLEKALALIEDEKNWCGEGWGLQGVTGRCGLHAVSSVLGAEDPGPAIAHLHPAGEVLNDLAGDHFGLFNDSHTHAQVIALFQEAIRNEKAKEGIEVPLVSERPAEPVAIGASRG